MFDRAGKIGAGLSMSAVLALAAASVSGQSAAPAQAGVVIRGGTGQITPGQITPNQISTGQISVGQISGAQISPGFDSAGASRTPIYRAVPERATLPAASGTMRAAPRPAGATDLPLEINWSTIDGGGAIYASAGGLSLGGTVGQPDVQIMSGGALTLRGGFWQGAAVPVCYANCNGDTDGGGRPVLDIRDFSCFQNRFALGEAYADCTGDGTLDVRDFTCFQNLFALGCP